MRTCARVLLPVMFLKLLFSSVAVAEESDADPFYDRYKSCGLQSVCFLANMYGIDIRLADLTARASASEGNSLYELKQLLDKAGLATTFAELSSEKLVQKAQERPLLLFLENKPRPIGHFVVVFAEKDGFTKCFEPVGIRLLDFQPAAFEQPAYKCLIFDKQPGQIHRAPRVKVGQRVVDFGQVWIGETARGQFHFQNEGNVPVRLGKVSVGCSCLDHSFNKTLLLRGETATLSVERNAMKRGPVNEPLAVFVEGARKPIQLQFVGRIQERYRVTPRQVRFQKCYPGDRRDLQIAIAPGDAEAETLSQEELQVEVETLELAGPLNLQNRPDEKKWQLTLPLAVPGKCKRGESQAKILIKNSKGPVGIVLVSFAVVGIMEIAPETIMVPPETQPGGVAGNARVKFTDGRLRDVVLDSTGGRFAVKLANINQHNATADIRLTLQAPLNPGVTKESTSVACPETGETRTLLAIANVPDSPKLSNANDATAETEETGVVVEAGLLSAGDKGRGAAQWITNELGAFDRAHPGIRLKTFGVAQPLRYEQPLESIPRLPENVVGVDSWSGYEIPYLVSQGLIVPIENFLPDNAFQTDWFDDALWQPVRYNGKTWGVPWASQSLFLVCNGPMFEQAGIGRPPATWDEMFECARRLTRDTNGDGNIDQWGLQVPDMDLFGFVVLSMVLQKGATVVSEEGFDMAQPIIVESLETVMGLINAPFTRNEEVSVKDWSSCGMQILDQQGVNLVKDNQDLVLAPLPTCGPPVSVNMGTIYLVIMRSTPEREAASWELVKWISRPEVSLPETWGGYPCRKDFVERADFQAIAAGSVQNLEILYTNNASLRDIGPNNLEHRGRSLDALWIHAFEALQGGSPDLALALREASEFANKMMTPIKTIDVSSVSLSNN